MKLRIILVSLLVCSYHIHSMDSQAAEPADDDAAVHAPQAQLATFPQVHFSPKIQDVLLKVINDEQESIKGALFRFTLYRPAQAIVKGIQERRISAELIVDESNIKEDFCKPLRLVAKAGGSIYKKDKMRNSHIPGLYEHMHHKFFIFGRNTQGKRLLWTGSFNVTGQADGKNCENVVILDDPHAIDQFEREFTAVKGYSTQMDEKALVSTKDTTAAPASRRMNGIPD